MGNGKVIDGTLTNLATAPVVVGDSLEEWVMLEQLLVLGLLGLLGLLSASPLLHWGSARLGCRYLLISHCFPLLWLGLGRYPPWSRQSLAFPRYPSIRLCLLFFLFCSAWPSFSTWHCSPCSSWLLCSAWPASSPSWWSLWGSARPTLMAWSLSASH